MLSFVQIVVNPLAPFPYLYIPNTKHHTPVTIPKMKWFTTLTMALLPATALGRFVSKRDDVSTTDTYLFDISLDEFISYRDAQDPATLDWDSDGCTDSPDNPLGFDYVSFHRLQGPL